MNCFNCILTLLLSIIGNSLADDVYIPSTLGYNDGPAEYWTCDTGVSYFVYDYTPLMLGPYSSYYDAICGYPPAIGAILLCSVNISVIQTEEYRQKIFESASSYCAKYSSYHYDASYYEEQYENATNYYVPLEDFTNLTEPMYSPTMPNISSLILEYKGYRAYYFNLSVGTWFSAGICGYFLILIIISAFHNFFRQTSIGKSINNAKLSKLCQKYVIFPTLIPNGKFTQYYGWKYFSILFPNRVQFITDVFIFGLQLAFYCVDYRYKGTYWFGSPKHSWQRFLADRTGIMAFGKIPLLILFAGRNNFLLSVTGWSYSTFLHFHKVLAYWMFLDSMIHSVAYTINSLGYYVLYLHDRYFACGVAATVLCGFLLLQAMHPFRRFFYEYFLTIHVVIAIAFIIMCWYHCRELGWLEWLIASCAVWFFDRLLRAIRIAAFGYRTAQITVAGDHILKIEVPKPSWWFHTPGTYCYIYFAGWIFWENNPFTCIVEGNNICAYIRVKRGVTARIWRKLLKNNNSMSTKVCIEGPYGGNGYTRIKKYDEVLLLAGGTGAAGILESATRLSCGKMIWVVTTFETIKAYQSLIQRVKLPLDIYITREEGSEKNCSALDLFGVSDSENLSTESSGKESEDNNVGLSSGSIKIIYGRPNLSELIDSSVKTSNSNNLGIMSCAPPTMSDEIRNIIAKDVTSWDKSVDYFDEFQIW